MRIRKKNFKKKKKIKNNNQNSISFRLKKDYNTEEEDELIRNNISNSNKKKIITFFNNIIKSFSQTKIIKITLILAIFLSINILLLSKKYIIIKDNSLNVKQKVWNFFHLCSNGKNLYKKRFKKNKNPKFSIIIPVLNKRIYLLKLMTSIQNQLYDNIEIVFVDDHSTDGSIELIQQYMRKDKRIVLIKHNKNMGTLITRNDGVLNANGEYILFVDPDDMILQDALEKLYETTLKYSEIDVIQFRAYKKMKNIFPWALGYKTYDTIVEQPELSSIMFYSDGKLAQRNYFIWGKLIKRKIFLETIDRLGEYYKNQYMTLYEDVAMLFVLLSTAKNYVYVNIFGYLYCSSSISVFENRFKYRRGNRTIRDCFLLGEFLFDFSKNTRYDKLMALYVIQRIDWQYYYVCSFVTEGFDYIFKVLDKFIDCKYLTKRNKIVVYKLKKLFEEVQKKLK